jgi:hypothetical protein
MATTTFKDDLGRYTNIEIGNMDVAQAAIVKAKIQGRTYMDFQVICAPIGGSICVSVETQHDSTPEEIQGMLMFTMATELEA